MEEWSDWMKFPDPRKGEYLFAPFGPGVYELRNKKTDEYILPGEGKNVSYRVSSLLPSPLGMGTRRNEEKRRYILANIGDIEYPNETMQR